MKKVTNVKPKRPIEMLTVKKDDLKKMLELIDTLSTKIVVDTKTHYTIPEHRLYTRTINLFRKYGIEACVIRLK